MTDTRVAVIGGGVIGLSIAYHLAEAGVETTLLERGALGSGASRATADVVRSYFAGNPVSSALAVRSLEAYRDFPVRPGADLPLRLARRAPTTRRAGSARPAGPHRPRRTPGSRWST
ncbi:FAD-dependent oxidoreductase, partial [Nonomuraea wenchangensis]